MVIAVERRTPTKLTNTMTTDIATFATRQEAQATIAKLNSGTYRLAHGEYERPDYTARKVRGEDCFYVHAKRYYYAGTFNAMPSGPVDSNRVAWLA